ncbi:hypothetical protein LCGC14_0475370 [marine sediment metagenome]|uniref:Uncharacterized protein n=1 Tax=marine sediment metagenome TaxID=412755 RepID=A0A0F9SG74_9ZZZZ
MNPEDDFQWTEMDGPMPKYLICQRDGEVLVHVGFADSIEQAECIMNMLRPGDHWSPAIHDLDKMLRESNAWR